MAIILSPLLLSLPFYYFSTFPPLSLQGVEPRWKGLNTAIPVVMVSKRAYRLVSYVTFKHIYWPYIYSIAFFPTCQLILSSHLIPFYHIPFYLISSHLSILVAESYSAGSGLSFEEHPAVSSAVWEPLEKLTNGEVCNNHTEFLFKRMCF